MLRRHKSETQDKVIIHIIPNEGSPILITKFSPGSFRPERWIIFAELCSEHVVAMAGQQLLQCCVSGSSARSGETWQKIKTPFEHSFIHTSKS